VASKFAGFKPVHYSVWDILQEKVYKRRVADLDDLNFKHRIKTD